MGFVYSVVGFLIAIGVLVAVHEFGHYWVARKLGVKVLKFSIGFGKPLWRKVAGPDQTEYVIAAIPLGGYVKMLGENDPDNPAAEHERHRAFDNQPIWKRSLIILAGPGINFLFAILLFTGLGLQTVERLDPVFGSAPEASAVAQAGVKAGDRLLSVNGRKVDYLAHQQLYIMNQVLQGNPIQMQVLSGSSKRTVEIQTADIPIYNISPSSMMYQLGITPPAPPISSEVAVVSPDSPAAKAGVRAGDFVVEISGQPVNSWGDLSKLIAPNPGKEINVVLQRDAERLSLDIVPDSRPFNGKTIGIIGVGPKPTSFRDDQLVSIKRGLWTSFVEGVDQTWQMSTVTLRMLGKMLTLQVSHKNINGPVMIASVAGQAIQIGLDYYIHILAVISISLGVMNLLPIPILDGGHLLVHLVEGVAGKRAAESFFAVGQRVGIFILIGFMGLAFYNDIFRLLN